VSHCVCSFALSLRPATVEGAPDLRRATVLNLLRLEDHLQILTLGAAYTTKRTTEPTSRPGPNLALRRANKIVGVHDDNVARFVRTNAGQPSEVDLAV